MVHGLLLRVGHLLLFSGYHHECKALGALKFECDLKVGP